MLSNANKTSRFQAETQFFFFSEGWKKNRNIFCGYSCFIDIILLALSLYRFIFVFIYLTYCATGD